MVLSLSFLECFNTRWYYNHDLLPQQAIDCFFIMVTKWNKLYDPEAYSTAYKVFILSNAMTLTFDLKKKQ
jgi:hypothetical protein